MFPNFRYTFQGSPFDRWSGKGLIIESASADTASCAYAKLRDVFPLLTFDLLAKTARSGFGFRNTFRVKRLLGGLRLEWKARKEYDLVVIFATGEFKLSLCRAFALLVMRPRRFFVFNENGDGFWLDQENQAHLRAHLELRYHTISYRWVNHVTRYRWAKRRDRFVADLRKLERAFVWMAWLPVRIPQMLYAGLLFLTALLLLTLMRITYDTKNYRFRLFGKTTAAPRR